MLAQMLDRANHQAPVVQKLDSTIRWINLYPVDSAIGFPNTYPLDSDYPVDSANPPFDQLELELKKTTLLNCEVEGSWIR